MTIKMRDLIRLHEEIRNASPEDSCYNSIVDKINEIGEYMNEAEGIAEKIILERVSEKDFVVAIDSMMVTLVYGMFIEEGRASPFRFLNSGDMKPFIHTIALAVIGMLIDEEVL